MAFRGSEKDGKAKAADAKDYILVIPFAPQMYACNGDHFICKSSNITPGELSDVLRRSITATMVGNLSNYYNCKEPSKGKPGDKSSDLDDIYAITRFHRERQKLKGYYKGYPHFSLWQMLGPRYMRWGSDCVNNHSEKPNSKRRFYEKAVVQNDSVFHNICTRLDASYALFITQLDINTRFKNCSDLQENIYQRDIFIHFSLLDNTGKYIDGGVVGTTFQSSTNDVGVIIDKNLGKLTGMIVETVRNDL
jgi:hypothetical protein